MATPATTPTVSPGVAKLLATFSTYAVIASATIQQEQADIAANDHVAAVTDGLTGVAAGLTQAKPEWGPDITASLNLAQTFIPLLVGLFHHKKPAAPAA